MIKHAKEAFITRISVDIVMIHRRSSVSFFREMVQHLAWVYIVSIGKVWSPPLVGVDLFVKRLSFPARSKASLFSGFWYLCAETFLFYIFIFVSCHVVPIMAHIFSRQFPLFLSNRLISLEEKQTWDRQD